MFPQCSSSILLPFFLLQILSSALVSSQLHPKANALKMLGPQKMPAGQKLLETDYFKPKEYSTKDFPRLIEGLGQQIRRDLEQAHSAMDGYADQVQRLGLRMDRLERQMLLPNRAELAEEQPANKLLIGLCLLLLLALLLLLFTNFILVKRLAGKGAIKHVRLTSNCSENEQF